MDGGSPQTGWLKPGPWGRSIRYIFSVSAWRVGLSERLCVTSGDARPKPEVGLHGQTGTGTHRTS